MEEAESPAPVTCWEVMRRADLTDEAWVGGQLIWEVKMGEGRGWQSVLPQPWPRDPLSISSSPSAPPPPPAGGIGALC